MRNAFCPWVVLAITALLNPLEAGAQTPSDVPSAGPPPVAIVYTASEPGAPLKQGKELRALRVTTTPGVAPGPQH
jgi:hypothetical protein